MNLFPTWVLYILTTIGATERVTPPDGLADEIASAAELHPLPGPQGPERMAAVLVAIAWAESRLLPGAIGDQGQSLGPFQLSRSWGSSNAAKAAELVLVSFAICSAHPLEHRLSWYAYGRVGCDHAHAASAHRMALAAKLLRMAPPPPRMPQDAPAPTP